MSRNVLAVKWSARLERWNVAAGPIGILDAPAAAWRVNGLPKWC